MAIIFVKDGLIVEAAANGGLSFSGQASLHDEEVPALIEAIRRHRAAAGVTSHLQSYLQGTFPIFNDATTKD